mmetsp:Transcript_40798/g.104417  ORF Transcript_40798/g.104417 Transcript_40798/m.104417 type:complete len:212 (+) Transcript_40798:517-1152(+)
MTESCWSISCPRPFPSRFLPEPTSAHVPRLSSTSLGKSRCPPDGSMWPGKSSSGPLVNGRTSTSCSDLRTQWVVQNPHCGSFRQPFSHCATTERRTPPGSSKTTWLVSNAAGAENCSLRVAAKSFTTETVVAVCTPASLDLGTKPHSRGGVTRAQRGQFGTVDRGGRTRPCSRYLYSPASCSILTVARRSSSSCFSRSSFSRCASVLRGLG